MLTAPQTKLAPLMMEGHIRRGTVSKAPMMEHEGQKKRIAEEATAKEMEELAFERAIEKVERDMNKKAKASKDKKQPRQ